MTKNVGQGKLFKPSSSKLTLRDYQRRGVNALIKSLHQHRKSILVAPTGAGKTVMIHELVERAHRGGKSVAGVVHRKELVDQLQERTGIDHLVTPQSGKQPKGDILVIDECHHYAADDWKYIMEFPGLIAGFTATPERGDGRPLGNYFDDMVVAVTHSELLRRKLLVPVYLHYPDEYIAPELSDHPAEGWVKYAPKNGRGFIFCRTVEQGYDAARTLSNVHGIEAVMLEGGTPADQRANYIQEFRNGRIRVLVNVYILTEGFDCPDADVCVLARGFGHVSTYLQTTGRVLRASPGKEAATIIDLAGNKWIHGSPVEDRVYTLERGIEKESAATISQCVRCGWSSYRTWRTCEKCGFQMPKGFEIAPKITNQKLAAVWCGEDTPAGAKEETWRELMQMCKSVDAAVYKYKELFGVLPKVNDSDKVAALTGLYRKGRDKGYAKWEGWAAYRFKAMFGYWPTPFLCQQARSQL